MDGIDPETLLEWLQTGAGDERDLQLMALEQLCMLLLMSDNIDRCFESCPPRTFLPALCKIFLDETAPDNVLEVTARAITYYLDVSNECTRRITQVDGAIKAICNRLAAAEMNDRSSKDLAEQCVKLLEHICQRETLAVYDAGGIHAMLTLVRQNGNQIHKDTMYSAMSVVTRLCGKMEPNEPALAQCAESLGALLAHEDAKVSESALRCFAALTDRFIRKSMDPIELARHSNLVDHLLASLCATEPPSAVFTSIVLSILSNLCRGSAEVTQQVLSNNLLIAAFFAVLTGKNDRCVTDGLRLADLLVVLLCEGRNSLPKNCPVSETGLPGSGTGERARHLIDAIRQKDTQALVEAIESGTVDVNYTDDVGQSLLNWAAAFGSIEMVSFLCDRGADVNKGSKSSSLHYAACFGRPDVVKMLLQRGANPDLRDEDGKTALDKARERSDEDHAQVAAILESPSVYMHAPTKKEDPPESMSGIQTMDVPDRNLAAHVLHKLVPVFCEIFQKSLNNSVRRSSLSLLRKSVQHMTSDDLRAAAEHLAFESKSEEARSFSDSLVGVLVNVLEQEEDVDGQEQVLLIMSSLLHKDSGFWVEELIRLGVFEKVESMAKEPSVPSISSCSMANLSEIRDSIDEMNARNNTLSRSTSSTPSVALESDIERTTPGVSERDRGQMLNVPISVDEDFSTMQTPPPTVEVVGTPSEAIVSREAKEKDFPKQIETAVLYRWKEWRIVRDAETLYIWADPIALEFPQNSNGWIRYLSDGQLWIMYSNGHTEISSSEVDAKKSFVTKWRRATAACGDAMPTSLLQIPNPTRKALVPSWELMCLKGNELNVRCNIEQESNPIIIKDEIAGFTYDSNEKVSVCPQTVLSHDFSTGWSLHGVGGRRARFRMEMQRKRVQELAWEVWDKYLKDAKTKPRDALLHLQEATSCIQEFVKSTLMKKKNIEHVQNMVHALNYVKECILDDRRLSIFELSVSGLVPTLVGLLNAIDHKPNSFPAIMFKEAFGCGSALSALARKMVLILESTEKFPQFLYDAPGGSAFGLQLLSRRFRLKLELAGSDTEAQKHLLNRTNRFFKSEPLTTIGQLKNFLLKMVAKQWYDRERETFNFVKQIQKENEISFTYTSDFDDQGIVYWLGTNGRTNSEWNNPALISIVKVSCSDAPRQPFGRPEDILSRDIQPLNCHSSDDKNGNFTVDLGCLIAPTAYTLRHARGYGRSALRNWLFQGSRDNHVWELLVAHSDDTSLGDPGSTATWPIEPGKGPYRYFRVSQNGKNSSGQTYYLSLSGFEIYGKVTDVIVEGFKVEEKEKKTPPSKVPTKLMPARGSKKSDEPKSPGNTSEALEMLPQGANNNRIKFGITIDQILRSMKSGTMRTKHSARLLRNMPGDTSELVGMVVRRGPDWQWDEQDAKMNGRVITYTKPGMTAKQMPGWIDVTWDNGYTNSYRYGYEGRFDVQRVARTTASDLLQVMRSHSILQPRRGVLDTSITSGNLMTPPSREQAFHSGFAPFGLRSMKPTAGGKNRMRIPGRPNAQLGSSTTQSSASSSIGKKSMSTTDLVDERARESGTSSAVTVAATGQAASAESLQHQTPSLENLLRGSRIYQIAERNETLEGRETPITGQDEQRSGSSQPLLSGSSTKQNEMDTSSSTQGGSGNLSLSTPELAAVIQRNSSEGSELTKALEEDEDDDENDDENEDGEPDDDEDDDDDDTDNDDRNEKKEGSLTDLLVEWDGVSVPSGSSSKATIASNPQSSSAERGIFERIREVIGIEDSLEQLLSAAATGADGVATNKKAVRKSSGGSLKAKIGTYADVLRSVMYQMMDPASGDIDEMDEEIFEDETDANEDELIEDHDLRLTAGILPRGLIGKIGNDGGIRLNWRQMSQLLMNEPNRLQEGTSKSRLTHSNLRQWDDEFVLKCQFQALIPAFDPRPGRSNVNQTQDVELPANLIDFPATPNPLVMNNDIKLRLFLRGPNLPGIENKTIELCKDEQSLFKCIQTLTNNIEWQQKGDKNRRIFDPTYTILYEDASAAPSVDTSNIATEESKVPEVVNQTLDVLNLLAKIATTLPESELPSNIFVSEKLTQKLIQELSDPLVVSSRSMPEWCERLIYASPCLFTMDTRNMYMQATAFGVSRSIVWLQSRRDAALEKTRGASSNATVGSATVRREDAYEYRVGRLKHERMKVTRSEDALLEQAIRVFRFHSFNKAVLEIEYNGEEGTGLGPTLEFYALVSAEMQRKALAIWWCDDLDESQLKLEEKELDLGEGKKPPGYYVRRAGGLFPAPLPPNTEQRRRASELFHVLGIFLAKVLQDGRLVDIPLSQPFLKLATHPKVNNHTSLNDLDGVLNLDDFEEVHPVKGRFLKELSSLAARKRTIECDENMDNIAKRRRIDELTMNFNGTRCKIEDLALNFTVNPPSTVFQYKEMELLEGGSDMDVTMDNVELYVEKCTDYYLNSGIIEQVRAFREGFDKVFPLHSLRSFTSQEVQCLISGEQCPEWTREDLINYTEPKLGYTRESPGFLRFVDVMVELTASERKSFLQFATGCSSLPPGGLANLHPRLTIVRKVESGDGSYPSVNTCVHYLKLPEYSSSEILRERLLTAITEKGFHLN